MKTRMLIVGCIVCLVALMIFGSCAMTSETRRERKALFQSAESGDYAEVKRLIEVGVDVNHQDTVGYTALMAASEMGHIDIVKLLIEEGADVNHQDDGGYTALRAASEMGHIDIVKLLIEEGADVNAMTVEAHWVGTTIFGRSYDKWTIGGYTALMVASEMGHTGIVKLLIEAGADVNAQADDGYTALRAASLRHKDIATLLIEAGAKE